MPKRSAVGRYAIQTELGRLWLNTDERNPRISPSRLELPSVREHPLQTLCRLARVTRVDDLGMGGPLLASVATPENDGNVELRRYEDIFTPDALEAAKSLRQQYPALEDAIVEYVAPYISRDGSEGPGAVPGAVPHHFYVREQGRPPAYRRTDANLGFIVAACESIMRYPARAHDPLHYPVGDVRAGEVVMRDGTPYTVGRAVVDVGKWLTRELSRYPHGQSLIWMDRANALGNSYTTWTDSPNHFHHRDGNLCTPPVASLLVQGKAFDALIALSRLLQADTSLLRSAGGLQALQPEVLAAQAAATRSMVLRHFVTTDSRGTFLSHAVDGLASGELERSGVQAIDMGMVLNTGLLDPAVHGDLRRAVVEQLFQPRMLSPFGLRGRATDEARSSTFDYHAQVWGFATHEAAEGLRRDGYLIAANELDARVMRQTHDGLNPEFVGGGPDPIIAYCPHILTVDMDLGGGKVTTTVKERTPQPHAAWTVAAVIATDALASRLPGSRERAGEFEQSLLGRLGDRAYLSPADLAWSGSGSASLLRAREALSRQPPLPGGGRTSLPA